MPGRCESRMVALESDPSDLGCHLHAVGARMITVLTPARPDWTYRIRITPARHDGLTTVPSHRYYALLLTLLFPLSPFSRPPPLRSLPKQSAL